MRRLFLFNPENDIALGSGLPRITPPRQAGLLHRAGAMLPFWLGEEGDSVIVAPEDLTAATAWRKEIVKITGVTGPCPVAGCSPGEELTLSPWGWSRDAAWQFVKAGVKEESIEQIMADMDVRRDLSHRKSALRFLDCWVRRGNRLPFTMPRVAFSAEDVMRFVETVGTAVVKSPWSSSGRGVFPVSSSTVAASLSRIVGIIRRQGSVVMEPMLPKSQDFAMLFYYKDGIVRFEGYSLFFNSTDTNYGGNYIGSDDMIMEKLTRLVPRDYVESVRNEVMEILPMVLGDGYEGPLGVDMMVCGDEEAAYWIDPCVEINLRYTMGFVAKGVWKKLGREGVMSIAPVGAAGIKKGERPVMLAPRNDWFDFLFCAYD